MKRTISTIVALMAILGSFAILTSLSPEHNFTAMADGSGTNDTLYLIWDAVNNTRSDLEDLSDKVVSISDKVDITDGRMNELISRLGYNDTNASVFNIRSDFDRLYQALYYSDNGTTLPILKSSSGISNLKIINDNQVLISDKTDRLSNSVYSAYTNLDSEISSNADNLNLNTGSTFTVAMIILTIIVMFIIWYAKSRRGTIHEAKEKGESLFMQAAPIIQEEPLEENPDCFKKLYNGNSSECKGCALKEECSGRPASRKKVPIRQSPGRTSVTVPRREHAKQR